MRDYTATPGSGGACMPCCQICVFAFTAFLIIAERTARESVLYLPGTSARPLARPPARARIQTRIELNWGSIRFGMIFHACFFFFLRAFVVNVPDFDFVGMRVHACQLGAVVVGHSRRLSVRVRACVRRRLRNTFESGRMDVVSSKMR